LSEIQVRDINNNLIKTVKLTKRAHSWLDKVQFLDSNNLGIYTYDFEYEEAPYFRGGIDYWGYFNGSSTSGTASYVPNFEIPGHQSGVIRIDGMNRNADFSHMKKGSLKKITYPTKGFSLFHYEAHKADNTTYGGLRIKEIETYDENSNLTQKKWYKYGVNESGNGRAAAYINDNDFFNGNTTFEMYEDENTAPVIGSVTVYREYTSFPKKSYFTSGSSVVYSEVTEYTGNASESLGRTKYQFSDVPDEYEATVYGMSTEKPLYSYSWRNGLLRNQMVFDKNNQCIYSINNRYQYLNESRQLNLKIKQVMDLLAGSANVDTEYIKSRYNLPGYEQYASAFGGSIYDYYNYYICTGLPVLSETTEYKNDVYQNTYYDEYNEYGFPTKIRGIDSRSRENTTMYKYVSDYKNQNIYNELFRNNIVSPVVETTKYAGSTLADKVYTEYNKFNNSIIKPHKIYTLSNNGGNDLRLIYERYDKYGNPIVLYNVEQSQTVVLWGYKGQYPIAEIRNATYDQVKQALGLNPETLSTWEQPNYDQINSLRHNGYIPDGSVTTYVYKPLVGITEVTDPRGVTTYYNYDNFGRLKESYILRDTNGQKQIIETYDYKYKNN
jgi:YD repeat-containing protein